MKRKPLWIFVLVISLVLTGLIIGYFLNTDHAVSTDNTQAASEKKILYWTDPMVPGYRSDKPGKSPFMDMQLVPVYANDETQTGMPVVSITSQVINNLGIRTYEVTRRPQEHRLTAQGYLFHEGGLVYALVDIFSPQADWLRAGLPAVIRTSAVPGREWSGKVSEVQTDIGVGARSVQVSVRVSQPDASLKPNMFVDVQINNPASRLSTLAVPREALIRTGKRTALVLALDQERFQPVDVIIGMESDDWIEIRQGIKEGDRVVISGQFLIDSESNVRASFRRMQSTPAADGTPETKP